MLLDELEEHGPFAPVRKRFCEFLSIGESTLTGWFKAVRVPRAAQVAYVLTCRSWISKLGLDEVRRRTEAIAAAEVDTSLGDDFAPNGKDE